MSRPGRRRSLFWTVAGLFILVAIFGSLVQVFVAITVLRPLELREARSRAELVLSNVAPEIAALPGRPRAADVDSLLAGQRRALGERGGWLVYRGADGATAISVPRSSPFRAIVERDLGVARVPADTSERRRRLETVARHAVTRGPLRLGEVLVVRPERPRGDSGLVATHTALLFVPFAVIGSLIAGLVLVRLLVRRLRALEALAERVAEGDLTVRIADTSGDEIGRLAEQLDRMTERLAQARTRLEENERQRRQLFADITHELATPLTSIRASAESLLDPGVPFSAEERGRYLRGVLEEASRLDRSIRDLFELARLEAGPGSLARERLDWAALCRNTAARFEPRFRAAGLALAWRDGAAPAWIAADGRRMEQVLENLLTNALRYVPAGGHVEVALERPAEAPSRYRLTVADDGPGLPPGERELAFDRFYRGRATGRPDAVRDAGGSGLGLAIVREIVERHGGSVRAEGREPHGLAIVVEIPAAA